MGVVRNLSEGHFCLENPFEPIIDSYILDFGAPFKLAKLVEQDAS